MWFFYLSLPLCVQSEIPKDWKQFPLTETEISLIQTCNKGGHNQIPLVNAQNQSCVLSPGPVARGKEGKRLCTWRQG